MNAIAEETIVHLKKKGIDEIYLTFDIDAVGAEYVSATGTPEPDGLTPDESVAAIEIFAKYLKITSGDIAEVAPFVSTKHSGTDVDEPESTLATAGEISRAIVDAMQFQQK